MKNTNLILTQAFTPSVENVGDVSQNIRIKFEGYKKNNNKVTLTGEIDLFQATQLVKELKKAVKKHHETVIRKVNMFNDQLTIQET